MGCKGPEFKSRRPQGHPVLFIGQTGVGTTLSLQVVSTGRCGRTTCRRKTVMIGHESEVRRQPVYECTMCMEEKQEVSVLT